MAYRKDFRWCVVNNVKQGMTWNEVMDIFRISRQTLSNWLKMADKNGDLSDPPRREYQTRKIAANELKELVEKQPDLTLAEYAEHFGCRYQAVANRLKKLGITRKNTHHSIKNEMKSKDKNTLTNSTLSK